MKKLTDNHRKCHERSSTISSPASSEPLSVESRAGDIACAPMHSLISGLRTLTDLVVFHPPIQNPHLNLLVSSRDNCIHAPAVRTIFSGLTFPSAVKWMDFLTSSRTGPTVFPIHVRYSTTLAVRGMPLPALPSSSATNWRMYRFGTSSCRRPSSHLHLSGLSKLDMMRREGLCLAGLAQKSNTPSKRRIENFRRCRIKTDRQRSVHKP